MVDTRSQRQQQGIAKWLANKCQGTFSWATGMGKSYTALTIIEKMQQKHPTASTHIVVPTLYLQEQFLTALRKAGLQRVEVYVINTYVRENRKCELLLVDEVHLMIGEHAHHFPKIFSSLCTHTWVLGLSATLTEEEQVTLANLGLPVVDFISMQQAQEAGWVAKNKTYNLGVPLTASETAEYRKWQDIFSAGFARFGHDFTLAMLCVGNAPARNAYAIQMGWKPELGKAHRWSPQSLGAAANQWLLASKNRQAVVNNATNKYTAALYLCREFPVKTICFSESTEFASRLAAMMPDIAVAYHSQIKSIKREYTTVKQYKTKPDVYTTKTKSIGPATLRAEAIASFADTASGIRVLSSAKALDQGADFQNLQLGIETSGNSSIRQKVQRTGRIVRVEKSLEEKLAVYVHIYALETYEANKLRRKQKGIPNIIETTNISDICF